jgi:hypothetical protein
MVIKKRLHAVAVELIIFAGKLIIKCGIAQAWRRRPWHPNSLSYGAVEGAYSAQLMWKTSFNDTQNLFFVLYSGKVQILLS